LQALKSAWLAYNAQMDTDRRGFFRVLGSVMAFLSGRASASPAPAAPEIHRATRNTLFGAVGRLWPRGRSGPPFHAYPDKATIALPPAEELGRPLAEVLRAEVQLRGFDAKAVSIAELATLLYHSNGITDLVQSGRASIQRRAAPSAGALYSGEVYVVAERVRGLEAGLYYYAVTDHQLVRLRAGPLLAELGRALLG
jgi:hypothetical protein